MKLKQCIAGQLALLAVVGMTIQTTGAAPREFVDFTFSMAQDVMGGGSGSEPVRGKTSPVWFTEQFTLGGVFMTDGAYGGKSHLKCFGSGSISGQIQLTKTKSGAASAIIWFTAFATDGKTEVKYELSLLDPTGWNGSHDTPFPPLGDDPINMVADRWSMETEGKGRLKNFSCTGSGSNDLFVELHLKRS